MNTKETIALLDAYNKLQNDFTPEDSVRVFGEGPGSNIWEKFEANDNRAANRQFPLWMLGDTERRKLAEYLLAQINLNEIL